MVVFHFVFDLEVFGHVSAGTTGSGFWRRVAVFSASSLCSILSLAFLRLPVLIIAVLAVVVFVAPNFATSTAFDSPWLWWTGLQTVPLRTVDYEPIFPWFAAFLAGMAVAKLASHLGLWEMLSTNTSYRGFGALTFFGRHTLIVYLIHQPILISVVWAGTILF